MKKFLFVSLCVLLLLSVGLVVASAEQVKAEAVTGSVDFGEMITYVMGEGENFPINIGGLINGNGEAQTGFYTIVGEDGEEQTVIYSVIVGGGAQMGEVGTYVIVNGADVNVEYSTFFSGGQNVIIQGGSNVIIQGGELGTELLAEGDKKGDDGDVMMDGEQIEAMVNASCASVIAPAVSTVLVSGAMAIAFLLRKKRQD